ncbi:hypothetical protein K8352_11875 [Flavobacteriaceae bacterium F89]|uniref:Uncharacterized protein n=1 Tax=Cerina litoralis TaxID=2874477 RepID=A0AAE3EXL1_9FLAO|nr:hypothetical protein [Cerina litoralis]MCG2461451.1 hypothetical protein [Cerina litoralis]
MKNNICFIFSLLIALSCSKGRNQEVVKSYITAHNAHDIKKVLALYDKNVAFELKGVWVKEGLSEMQSLEVWDAALHSNLRLESTTSKEDSVFCRIVENNDWFGAVGITNLVHDPTVFVVKNGKNKKNYCLPIAKNRGKNRSSHRGALSMVAESSGHHN